MNTGPIPAVWIAYGLDLLSTHQDTELLNGLGHNIIVDIQLDRRQLQINTELIHRLAEP